MFGKSRQQDAREREAAILQCRVSLRKLQRKHHTILERELRMARELKAANLKSPANETKIRINYYLLRVIDKTMVRLSDISDTAELKETMNEFSQVLASINKMASRVEKADSKSLVKGIKKMNKDTVKEEQQLNDIFNKMDKSASFSAYEEDIQPIENDIEYTRNETIDPIDKHETTEDELEEIHQYLDELIKDL